MQEMSVEELISQCLVNQYSILEQENSPLLIHRP